MLASKEWSKCEIMQRNSTHIIKQNKNVKNKEMCEVANQNKHYAGQKARRISLWHDEFA
jgi:hypothetical protein